MKFSPGHSVVVEAPPRLSFPEQVAAFDRCLANEQTADRIRMELAVFYKEVRAQCRRVTDEERAACHLAYRFIDQCERAHAAGRGPLPINPWNPGPPPFVTPTYIWLRIGEEDYEAARWVPPYADNDGETQNSDGSVDRFEHDKWEPWNSTMRWQAMRLPLEKP